MWSESVENSSANMGKNWLHTNSHNKQTIGQFELNGASLRCGRIFPWRLNSTEGMDRDGRRCNHFSENLNQ